MHFSQGLHRTSGTCSGHSAYNHRLAPAEVLERFSTTRAANMEWSIPPSWYYMRYPELVKWLGNPSIQQEPMSSWKTEIENLAVLFQRPVI